MSPLNVVSFLCLIVVAVHSKRQCIGKEADIMFVLDSSSSVWIVDYNKQLKFVADLVDSFDVGSGSSQVRVGAITFSTSAHLEFSLDRYTDAAQLKKAILEIPHRKGITNTADALRLLKDQVEPQLQSSKRPVVAVVITDGLSRKPVATSVAAHKLHQLGITVYAIGVGDSSKYDINELKAIASDPDNNVYTVSSYSALKDIALKFYNPSCEESTPPPTTMKPIPPQMVADTPVNTQPIQSIREKGSTIIFGYDLLSLGSYRAKKISQFINSLLPYTGYGYYKVVSYAYCPEDFNIPVTSLMNKNRFEVQQSATVNAHLPSLVEVVRQIRSELYSRAIQNINGGLSGNQVAVLFVDPSSTVITPELVSEVEKLRRQGSKLFVVSVGEKETYQAKQFYSLAGRPNTYSYPTYKQLLYSVKHTPFRFRAMCHRYTPQKRFL